MLPDAIDLFTRTMRAGHNIHSGLETIATETSDPVKMEFKKLMEELALGSQVEPALHELGKRVPLIDLKFFITGLILQRQTGANMVAVLENLSTLVRERLNMAAKLKAHTAQQRFSAGLLCCLPLVVGIGFWILKPEYIRLLWTDPVGSKFFTYAIMFGDRGHSGDPQDWRTSRYEEDAMTRAGPAPLPVYGRHAEPAFVDWLRALPRRRKTRWATVWKDCNRRRWWWRRGPRGARNRRRVWTGSCT